MRYDTIDAVYIYLNLEQYRYKCIDERSKVWYLIVGIESVELNSGKSTILVFAPYRQDYDASVILYKYYIKQAKDMNIELNISGVGTGDGESSAKGTLTGKI